MKCPNCDEAELVQDTRDMPYTYKGESTTIPGVTGDFCPACGEFILDAAESARASSMMLDFNRQVNASIVDPEFSVSVREKLALDQREAAACLSQIAQSTGTAPGPPGRGKKGLAAVVTPFQAALLRHATHAIQSAHGIEISAVYLHDQPQQSVLHG